MSKFNYLDEIRKNSKKYKGYSRIPSDLEGFSTELQPIAPESASRPNLRRRIVQETNVDELSETAPLLEGANVAELGLAGSVGGASAGGITTGTALAAGTTLLIGGAGLVGGLVYANTQGKNNPAHIPGSNYAGPGI